MEGIVGHSAETTKLFAAYVKFSADVGSVEKNKTNPHFKARYADLASAIETSKPHLATHNLAVMQHLYSSGGYSGVRTMLVHDSGQWIASDLMLKPQRDDPQAHGSAITYARRYAFMAILGMAPDDVAPDDDGNDANKTWRDKQAAQPSGQPAPIQRKEPEQPRAENFNIDDPDHLARLEMKLEEGKLVPKDRFLKVAEELNGKPMTGSTLKAAIEAALRAA